MPKKAWTIDVTLRGTKPIMFDRLPANCMDSKVTEAHEAQPELRMYREETGALYLPAENLYSFLCSQSGASCVNRWGPQLAKNASKRREMAENILAFVDIDPEHIPFLRSGDPLVFGRWDVKTGADKATGAFKHFASPRVVKGRLSIPQPKTRPVLPPPWELAFTLHLKDNPSHLAPKEMYDFFDRGGRTIGLGAYRPRFGCFEVSTWTVHDDA